MQSPTYLTPGLGGKSLMVVCAWAVFAAAAAVWIGSEEFSPLYWRSLATLGWQLGITYGFGCGLSWAATCWPSAQVRLMIRILIVAICGFLMSLVGTPDWIRHAVNLAGMLLGQSMLFAVVRVPNWTRSTTGADSVGRPAYQFRIAELLATTTAFACLLGLTIRYAPPVENLVYWPVMLLIWCGVPGIAACFAKAPLALSAGRVQILVGLGLLLICLLTGGLSLAESYVAQKPASDDLAIPFFYGFLFVAAGATMSVFGFAGRLQGSAEGRPSPLEWTE